MERMEQNMSECKMKDSRIVISEVMMPSQANPNGNVHGGEITKLMDSAAYAAARRYARSMEISVNVIVEDLDEGSDPQLGLSAYFTMVALDRNARPKTVPPLELKTEEARVAFEEGKRRYEAHKARKRGVTIPTSGCVCDAIAQQAKAASEQREAEKQ